MEKMYKGLSDEEVIESRRLNGENVLKKEKIKGLARRFFENLSDPIIKILIIALACEVIFTFGKCNLVEVLGIIAAILISTTVSTVSEYSSERAFKRIEEEAQTRRVKVTRNCEKLEIPSTELVVGDIVHVEIGEQICADGILVSGEIHVDQSALNGENLEVQKTKGKRTEMTLGNENCVFSGSVVTEGSGIMRVLRVGGETYYGMVAKEVQAETRVSPLKLRLSKLAAQISKLGYVAAGLVGFVYLFNSIFLANGFESSGIIETLKNPAEIFSILIHTLTLMITVVVVAVPEGLPMMITVVLSANMRRMVKDNVLVKKMVGIETAGSLNILFTDKTGTLTTGRLCCESVICEEGRIGTGASGAEYPIHTELLRASAHLNTESVITKDGVMGGNVTDRAILEYFSEKPKGKYEIVKRVPFKSELKYSSITTSDGKTIIKGAAEIIIASCKYALMKDGRSVVSSLDNVKRSWREAVNRGERVLAVAMYDKDGNEGATFVALIILKDKLRQGVKKSVNAVMKAGIQIVMLTGDNKDTATAIAEECGFYKKSLGHIALNSEELGRLSDEELRAIIPNLRVVARALPTDKTRLVRISSEMDLVTGMTGDGINDAPSLKLADVGFAMGSGTDIAKSAGDIVILDDSFSAIEKTVLYGRTIFKSIRKFVTFQLIMNLAACGITLLGQIFGIENPITIIQMLWVNIIMDTLGGLAFAAEPPMKYYMLEKPKRRDEPILDNKIIANIVLCGGYTLLLLVLFLRLDVFLAIYGDGVRRLTAFFALFVFAGIFNCLAARSERVWLFHGITKNRPFILIMLLISVIQIFIIYFGGEMFRSTPLEPRELAIAVLTGMSVLAFDFIRRIYLKLR